jgi:hypothetical protein
VVREAREDLPNEVESQIGKFLAVFPLVQPPALPMVQPPALPKVTHVPENMKVVLELSLSD